jgi:hypothetical protein
MHTENKRQRAHHGPPVLAYRRSPSTVKERSARRPRSSAIPATAAR